jgi:phosphohistidine phosphatase
MSNNKELLLLRHGKSDWDTNTTDFNRPLNERGRHNSLQMGNWLFSQNLIPDLVISSPATRALTTTQIVCEAMGLAENSIQTEKSVYEARLADLHQILRTLPDSVQRLLLVGHNPGFEYLVNALAPDISTESNRNIMPTATLAYLQLDTKWSLLQDNCFIQRAKDLPE